MLISRLLMKIPTIQFILTNISFAKRGKIHYSNLKWSITLILFLFYYGLGSWIYFWNSFIIQIYTCSHRKLFYSFVYKLICALWQKTSINIYWKNELFRMCFINLSNFPIRSNYFSCQNGTSSAIWMEKKLCARYVLA